VIDWIDTACKAWGRCTRRIIAGTNLAGDIEGFPTRDTIERARQGLLDVKQSGPRSQHFHEVRLGDALLVANAMKQTPLMPLPLQGVLWCHYVVHADLMVRVKTLGRFIGRSRDREAMTRADYWRLLDRAHYFLSARIAPPGARDEPRHAA
jgi:hypothetical protein